MTTRTATVITISDSVSAAKAADKSGSILENALTDLGFSCVKHVIPDEMEQIHLAVLLAGTDLIVTTGGTGIGPRDVTPEAVVPLIEKRLTGVEEAYRAYGLRKTPMAMLSRNVAGTRGKSLILCLPGSPTAVQDAVDFLVPTLQHIFEVMEGGRHD